MDRFPSKKGQLTEKLLLRLTPEMKDRLLNASVDENVSMNTFVLTLITEELERREEKE